MTNDYSIVPPHLAVKAMRDNGYKNMAYALAELIDNSIQAGATDVDVLLAERYELVQQRAKSHVYQIAVLDNGSGMNATVLRMALQFGNGTRLEAGKRTGMGRFGMGLPSASISQCRRVEVWSWQGDITKALYTYLDLDDIEHQRTREIPIPQQRAVPKLWLDSSEMIHPDNATGSGTLVVWSNIDRSNWSTSKAIIKNSEFVVGRMYRHFLYDNTIRITMRSIKVSVDAQTKAMRFDTVNDDDRAEFLPHYIQPNDPLHLHAYHQLPAPWDKQPMFAPFGEFKQVVLVRDIQGVDHEVIINTSIARPEAREGDLAGAKEHGKHAARNVGISIVRAGRELDMDEGQVIQHDPVERWWGMEILFPPALDEVFGVTNNKQAAVILREILNHKDVSSRNSDEMMQTQEYVNLQKLWEKVRVTLQNVRQELGKQKQGIRTLPKRNPESLGFATKAITQRAAEGNTSASDQSLQRTSETQRITQNVDALVQAGTPQPEALQQVTELVMQGRRAIIKSDFLDSSAIFSVLDVSGILHLTLNRNHPAYDVLFVMLDDGQSNRFTDAERLRRTRVALEMLLFSWARMEDESRYDAKSEDQLRRTREMWGNMAREFLAQLNEHK